MALVNGTNYDHIDLQAAGGDVTRHRLQDTAGRALVAPAEAAGTAGAAHAAGSYFIYNDLLYQASADIAQGGTILAEGGGANCRAVTVGGEIVSIRDALRALEDAKAGVIVESATGPLVSFPDGVEGSLLKACRAEITPLQPASSEYLNTPNIWDEQWEQGGWSAQAQKETATKKIRCKNYIPVTPGASYYIKSPYDLTVRELNADKEVVQSGNMSNAVLTVTENTRYLAILSAQISAYENNISINTPATDTDYHPYQLIRPITGGRTGCTVNVSPTQDAQDGTDYQIAFGHTVYGGSLNVTAGVLESTHALAADLGDLTWTYDAVGGYFTSADIASTAKANSDKGYCSILPVGSALSGDRIYVGANGAIIAYYAAASTAAEFAEAMDGQQFVYELATGSTYQLTPRSITALAGQNCIWADTGNVTVRYRADTKGYIDKKIAAL